jgi:hypothetical protein
VTVSAAKGSGRRATASIEAVEEEKSLVSIGWVVGGEKDGGSNRCEGRG